MSKQITTIVIGAGPIGLELAVALKLADTKYLHLEAGQIGQTITWYPKQAQFFSSPDRIALCGVPLQTVNQSKATREEYLAYLRSIVQQFKLSINTYETVTCIEPLKDHKFQVTTSKSTYEAQNVIVTIGDMHRARKINVPGEDLPHVSHYFDEPHKFFNQKLLIVGGKNSAVEAAIRCHRAGAKVSISYRRDQFNERSIKYWLLPEIKWLIENKKIDFHPESIVTRITPTHVQLDSMTGPQKIEADFALLLTGYEMDPSLFQHAGVKLQGKNRSPQFDNQTMETNIPGLYVAGTAAGGTQQSYKLFIENCHSHIVKIMRSFKLKDPTQINELAYTHLQKEKTLKQLPES
ncbi:MAG: NAD(P)-binding domain-containing protein [Phycisphaeraceae bacterium]|nr:NAD(P)-binding domain-containing protein [Phycisphaeraceae bacterium]